MNEERARGLARLLADRIDRMFTMPEEQWLGGSVQRKASLEVLLRETLVRCEAPPITSGELAAACNTPEARAAVRSPGGR